MIHIRLGSSAHIDTVARLLTAARYRNPFDWACHPECYSSSGECTSTTQHAELVKVVAKRATMFHQALQDTFQNRFFVAVDSDLEEANFSEDAIVGFVHWQVLPRGVDEERWALIMKEVSGLSPKDDFVTVLNPTRREIRGVAIPHINLLHVNVLPQYQGRGIGKLLAKLALQEADELGLPVFLDSTPDGAQIYPSLGFDIKAQFTLDLRKYGVDEPAYVNYIMWREPGRGKLVVVP